MKVRVLPTLRRVLLYIAMLFGLFPVASIAANDTAAQEESKKGAQKEKDTPESKTASVRIAVLLADPDKGKPPTPIANATVKVEGVEDAVETDEDGKTRTLIMSPGTMVAAIKPTGHDPCNITASVAEGSQVVAVVVEMARDKLTCSVAASRPE